MAKQKRNLSQEFEILLNGRSILDLTEKEAAFAIDTLTEIVKNKPPKSLTKVELQSLIEELSNIFALNMFKGNVPDDWKEKALNFLENSDEKNLDWDLTSILDFYLHDVEMWCVLDGEGKEAVAKTMLKYLEGKKDYYDYFMGYAEGYLDDEDEYNMI